jgi:hypothetical protein
MLPRIVPEDGDTVCGMWMPGGSVIYYPVLKIRTVLPIFLELYTSTLLILTTPNRQAYLYSLGHFSAIQNASMMPLPLSLSDGYLKLCNQTRNMPRIKGRSCRLLVQDREYVWEDTWLGQNYV